MSNLHHIFQAALKPYAPISEDDIRQQYFQDVMETIERGGKVFVHMGKAEELELWLHDELTQDEVLALARARLSNTAAASITADAGLVRAVRHIAHRWADEYIESNWPALVAEQNERPHD